ncbi:hypothetical protein PVAP13_9NG311366 [Panicum virgatum]|uniref:Uncharacterized protein n=1 Tax=Panicum virgatum TaxID=38727 RepID=A0A8T0MFP7_PANVG|nr:hypothetical protein PVAP13_9NG311366 [Panicum virgatum]
MPSDLSPLCGMLPRPPKTLCPTSQPSLRAWSATQLASSHRCSKRGPAVHGVEVKEEKIATAALFINSCDQN